MKDSPFNNLRTSLHSVPGRTQKGAGGGGGFFLDVDGICILGHQSYFK